MKHSRQPASNPVFSRDIDFSGKESIGQRENQEDFSIFRTLGGGSQLLAVMADGMGGHASGEVASKKAVDSFNETFATYPSQQLNSRLAAALQQANAQIAQSINEVPALDGMGCTLIGAHIDSNGLSWISVGDSLLYLFRGKKIRRLNADHSMMALIRDSVASGKMSEAEAKNYPYKNALRSAVMGGEITLIDASISPLKLQRGDVIVVATDGLLSLSEPEILNVIRSCKESDASTISTNLIRAVESKKRPKQDNTSVQVIVVPDSIAAPSSKLLKTAIVLMAAGIIGGVAAGLYISDSKVVDIGSSVENAFKPSEPKTTHPIAIPVEREAPQPEVKAVQPEKKVEPNRKSEQSKVSSKPIGASVKKGSGLGSPVVPVASTDSQKDGASQVPITTAMPDSPKD